MFVLIGDVLFPPAERRRSGLAILSWWEARRPTYNLIVGATGAFTVVAIRLISIVPPGIKAPLDWRPVVAYAVLANVCYSFGWVLESAAQRLWGDRVRPLGPALFRQGVAFSVGLTLLPVLVASMAWVVRLGLAIFR